MGLESSFFSVFSAPGKKLAKVHLKKSFLALVFQWLKPNANKTCTCTAIGTYSSFLDNRCVYKTWVLELMQTAAFTAVVGRVLQQGFLMSLQQLPTSYVFKHIIRHAPDQWYVPWSVPERQFVRPEEHHAVWLSVVRAQWFLTFFLRRLPQVNVLCFKPHDFKQAVKANVDCFHYLRQA